MGDRRTGRTEGRVRRTGPAAVGRGANAAASWPEASRQKATGLSNAGRNRTERSRNMAVLVTGGAGYIGSHTVAALLERGEEVVVLDNLQQGHGRRCSAASSYVGELRDEALLNRVFDEHESTAVIHFAANSLVGREHEGPGQILSQQRRTARCACSSDGASGREAHRVLVDGGGRTASRSACRSRRRPDGADERLRRDEAGDGADDPLV